MAAAARRGRTSGESGGDTEAVGEQKRPIRNRDRTRGKRKKKGPLKGSQMNETRFADGGRRGKNWKELQERQKKKASAVKKTAKQTS